jgi:hypothetical protein
LKYEKKIVSAISFMIILSISRYGYTQTNNKGYYCSMTVGYWSTDSIRSGSGYQSYCDDYVFQSLPSQLTITGDSFSSTYWSKGTKGVEGDDYQCIGGNNNYIQYTVADDPLGSRTLQKFDLIVTSEGLASTSARLIRSYYVHTWRSVSISSITYSSSGALSITASNSDKSWKVYNYVSFNF